MEVELPKTAFVPGETIPFKISICNLSNSNVEKVKVKLVKTTTYKVTSPKHESKTDEENLVSFSEHGVGAHGEYTYNLELQIPGYIDVPNFTKCELFKVSYELEVSAEMPSCTMDLDINAWDIKIGHIQCGNYGTGDSAVNSAAAAYPTPAYPPAPGVVYPPAPGGGVYPPSPNAYVHGGLPPYPTNDFDKKPISPLGPPSAPSSSIASAPMEDNPKAREAASGGTSGVAGFVSELRK